MKRKPFTGRHALFVLLTAIILLFTIGPAPVRADNPSDSESESTEAVEQTALSSEEISLNQSSYTYTGSEITPEITVTSGGVLLEENTDYAVSYSSNIDAGTASITVTGTGNYTGTVTTSFEILPATLEDATVVLSKSSYTYKGKARKPSATVTLGDITLTKNTDYSIAYKDNIDVGTATAVITGINNYTGQVSADFIIKPLSIKSAQASLSKTSYTYNGKKKKPKATIVLNAATLQSGQDYTIKYKNNTDVGTASAVITGKGNYSGTLTLSFQINPGSARLTARLSATSYTYNGKAKTPKATVKSGSTQLKLNKDYTITYANNINAGTASVIIAAKGNYSGTKTVTFKIRKASISKHSLTLKKKSYTYNGKKRTPGVTVSKKGTSLKKAQDYTVTYKKNLNPGIAQVLVKGTGNYSGTLKKTFKILPRKANLYNIQHQDKSLVLTWEEDSVVTGFEICRKDKSGKWSVIKTVSKKASSYSDSSTGNFGDSYKYRIRAYVKSGDTVLYGAYSKTLSAKVQHGAMSLSSVTPESSTSFILTWKKQSSASGYEIYRRENNSSDWKKIKTITSGGKTSYSDTGLTYGKTYTYSIRSYNKSGGKTVKGVLDENGYTAKLAYGSKYSNGYKFYYDAAGNLIKDVDKIIGKQSSYQIKVNKQANVVTVYAKDGDNGYMIPVKAFLCSAGGSNTPVGTFYTPEKYRWHTLSHGVEGQWCTRIHGGVLFHSVWYYSRSKTDLTTVQYNRLGSTASAGCVRVNCASAKWIYDNCSLGTSVTIYTSSNPGPLGKPEGITLPSWHTWDPTDPTCEDLCAERGCH